jgi:hypothetical protein
MVAVSFPAMAELERRMRPGAWSEVGFLGETESLSEVLARDERTLAELRLTCGELAESLSLLIAAPEAGLTPEHAELLSKVGRLLVWEEHMQSVRARVETRFGSIEQTDLGAGVARVAERYEIQLTHYLGSMTCPWECPSDGENSQSAANTDWRIRNTARDLELSGPTLIT